MAKRHKSKKKAKINIVLANNDKVTNLTWEIAELKAKELNWITSTDNNYQHFYKIVEDTILYSLNISKQQNCSFKVLGHVMNYERLLGQKVTSLDPTLTVRLLELLSSKKICPGNPDFDDVCRHRFPGSSAKFENNDGKLLASEENFFASKTVRTSECYMLCNIDDERCAMCQLFRQDLHTKRSRLKKVSSEIPAINTRLDYMNPLQLKETIINTRDENRAMKRKINSMKEMVEKSIAKSGIELDLDMTDSFVQIMKENAENALSKFDENSPQHILWKQQLEAASNGNLRQMRWHPTLLRWCIALHAKSPAAYRMIKKSNILTLPHENTLRDYTKFTKAGSGMNADVIARVIEDFEILSDPSGLKKNISVLFDEVKVKSGLVYCSETGRLIGFCDLGTVNNLVQNFSGEDEETAEPELATHILAIMIRGIFSNLQCVVAHYPCRGFNSNQLFWVVWDSIGNLELAGFHVRALVCDGATPNRKFYRIHGNQDPTHYTSNIFGEDRNIYFICDAPHLMKTTRNNFENSGWHNKTRNLVLNGKPIKWSHIVTLVENDIHRMGLRLLPRITFEQLHLSPTLRMKVKLAVQVLSTSVANGLELQGNPDTESTQKFIRMFDQFFDCLNVSNFINGMRQRKPASEPYKDSHDWRFEWLEKDFLGFLQSWEQEGNQQQNLTAKEKKQLCLSRETLEGLRITVKSFVKLGKELLGVPNVRFLLSEKFNQDPLEEYFSKQRGMGGFCDNPTVRQFQHNALTLQVAGAPAVLASTRGNCRNDQLNFVNNGPLPRRQNNRR